MGNLDEGENIRYEFPLPEDGVTLKMCVQNGQVNCYASTEITTPNSALHDYKLEVKAQSPGMEACDDVYIQQPTESRDRDRRAVIEKSNTTLFMTLTGMDEYNEFSFNTTLGDTTSGEEVFNSFYIVIMQGVLFFRRRTHAYSLYNCASGGRFCIDAWKSNVIPTFSQTVIS